MERSLIYRDFYEFYVGRARISNLLVEKKEVLG
jgi:hypothetical protein